jgi:hypothetical protein
MRSNTAQRIFRGFAGLGANPVASHTASPYLEKRRTRGLVSYHVGRNNESFMLHFMYLRLWDSMFHEEHEEKM